MSTPITAAPNTQTWWDAVCNCTSENYAHWSDAAVTSDDQYEFYQQMRDDAHSHARNENQMFNMNPDERFMYLCFMSAAFDPD